MERCNGKLQLQVSIMQLTLFNCVDLGVEFGNFLAEFVDLKAQFDVDEVD